VRRILPTVFALMVLLPSVAFARSEYLCRLDGQVRSSCCCPTKVQKHEAPRPASVREACCCTIVEATPSRAQPATAGSANDLRSHLVVLVADVPVHAALPPPVIAGSATWPHATAPPGHSRDLFARHCAFLL
jgi:hypothetical protein